MAAIIGNGVISMNQKTPNNIKLHQTRSILEELSRAPRESTHEVLENRGHHVVSSAINFLQSIQENYEPEEAEAITKRFLSAIKGSDPQRFVRQIRKIKESRENRQ